MTQDNKPLTKAKAVNSEFASSLEAERADLAEAEKSLAAVLASEAASKNSCAQVVADHEVSVKAFAEEFEGFGRCHTSPQVRDWCNQCWTSTMVRRLAQKEHSADLISLHLSCVKVWCWCL